jgi:LPS sulfotransferase NodH
MSARTSARLPLDVRLRVVPNRSLDDVRSALEASGVRRSFFICASKRTGSTMLAELLADTGLVGRADEYFGNYLRPTRFRSGRVGVAEHLVSCASSSRETGVLGCKLHWEHLPFFVGFLGLLRGARGCTDLELVERAFPDPCFLWIRREDLVAQAVSWWKATSSEAWLGHEEPLAAPRFDFAEIQARARRAEEQVSAWKEWFAANGIEPLPVRYEELVAEPAALVRRALRFIGVPVPDDLVVETRTRRQADEVNEEWIRRYLAVAGSGAR